MGCWWAAFCGGLLVVWMRPGSKLLLIVGLFWLVESCGGQCPTGQWASYGGLHLMVGYILCWAACGVEEA